MWVYFSCIMSFEPFFCGLDVISGPWNFYLRTRQHYKADKRVDISEAVSDSDEELYLVDASTHILDFGRLSLVQSSHFGTECPTLCAKMANTIWAAISTRHRWNIPSF